MVTDFAKKSEKVIFGNDSIVIRKYINGIDGGRTLDTADFPDKVIKAGHVIIAKDGVYKPMPLALVEDCYGYTTLPEGFKYVGILYRSVLASMPVAAIMTWGEVNIEAVPYAMDNILNAFKTECPFIDFKKDEEA